MVNANSILTTTLSVSVVAVLGAHAAFVGSTPADIHKSKYIYIYIYIYISIYGLCLHCGQKDDFPFYRLREIESIVILRIKENEPVLKISSNVAF